jgi:ABC-type cobalt transport system substrate-binding protein
MKHKILSIMGAVLLMLTLLSCHKDSDTLVSYDHNETLVFGEAENSFEGKFKVLWNALNQNYALWDLEKEKGLDWDKVYDTYLPKFQALDKQNDVTDDVLSDLLYEVLGPLHDSHMIVEVKNHRTAKSVEISPSEYRNSSRDDYEISKSYDLALTYYTKKENGEIELDADGKPCYAEYSTSLEDLMAPVMKEDGAVLKWINDSIDVLEDLTLPTEEQLSTLSALKALLSGLNGVQASPAGVEYYNMLATRFAYLEVPGLDPIHKSFGDVGLSIKYALLKGKIAYMGFSDFSLSPYLEDAQTPEYFPDADEFTLKHIHMIKSVWNKWFQTIQQLHKSGELGGVILDVRGNGGGFLNDFQYVFGALLPSGGFTSNYIRYKRGTGRLDYSPWMPNVYKTISGDHVSVTEPIVVLSNCSSVSMAEITSLSAKVADNARLIGKRTWGGLCALTDNIEYSYNYSGHIGVKGVTPVYVYLPMLATKTLDGQQLEGIGITPDIEVDLDSKLYETNGKDTQLDRALQYIRTGN